MLVSTVQRSERRDVGCRSGSLDGDAVSGERNTSVHHVQCTEAFLSMIVGEPNTAWCGGNFGSGV